MDYEKTVPFEGNLSKVIELATSVFTPFGLAIASRSDSSVEFTGANLWITSQNPFVAISRIRIQGTGTQLTLTADLKGLQRLFRFVGLMLCGMALAFVLVFGLFFRQGDLLTRVVLPVLPFVPWIVLFPILKYVIRSRTCQALDILLQNLTIVGRSA
ncbi:MAG TPA: hypothetical protein PKH07_16635 [bacterium]|nr:hypothetical protein [bacterium]